MIDFMEIKKANTQHVKDLYESYPFPSRNTQGNMIFDLANNISCHFDNKDLEGMTILDAGCGSGHRLMGLAKRFPDAHFIGLDLAKNNLSIAHSLAKYHGIKNVELIEGDIIDVNLPYEFSMILSTGVVHHLENPAAGIKKLHTLLKADGLLIVWLYHTLGEHDRILKRELLMTMSNNLENGYQEGLSLIHDMHITLNSNRYGRFRDTEELIDQEIIDVDAYMHPIVNTYRILNAIDMAFSSGFDWATVSGINYQGTSKLLDLEFKDDSEYSFLNLRLDEIFDKPNLKARFLKLDNSEKTKVIELILKPTGFTLFCGTGNSMNYLPKRIKHNLI